MRFYCSTCNRGTSYCQYFKGHGHRVVLEYSNAKLCYEANKQFRYRRSRSLFCTNCLHPAPHFSKKMKGTINYIVFDTIRMEEAL